MTKRELNNGIKKLHAEIAKRVDTPDYFNYVDGVAKKEYLRLYNADNTFESFNKESIKILIRLNLKHRFISIHNFGIHINY